MKWIGISGSWRPGGPEIERDVRAAVHELMERGDGIVSGGALGVDYFATDEALKTDPAASRIKIFLPVTLERYAAHYRKRADEGVITHETAELLIAQLTRIKDANPEALIENQVNTVCDPTTYFERNTEVMNASDEILAFQINGSGGTQDTIDKARAEGKPVTVHSYTVE